MPSPTAQLSTTRPDIAETMEEFDLDANNNKMVATQVLPVFDVPTQAGKFGKIPVEELLQNADTERSSQSGYNRSKYKFTDHFYVTSEHGKEEVVDDRDEQMYSDYFDLEVIAAKRARANILINQEIRAANNTISNASVTGAAAATVWTTHASATPIADVNAAVLAIYNRTGVWPDSICLSYSLFRELRQCTEVLDRIQSAGAGDQTRATDVTVQQIAQVFDLNNVLVAGASKNSADQGLAVSVAQIWDETRCFVFKSANSVDLKEPCFGRTFHWSQDGSQIGGMVETYRDETVRADVVRCRHEVQENVVYTELGQRITGCKA